MIDNDKLVRDILDSISESLGISEEMLKSTSRKAKISTARKIFSYLCRENGFYFKEIGYFLNKDVSSIHYQANIFLCNLKYDMRLKDNYLSVKSCLDKKLNKNEEILS